MGLLKNLKEAFNKVIIGFKKRAQAVVPEMNPLSTPIEGSSLRGSNITPSKKYFSDRLWKARKKRLRAEGKARRINR